jgi:nicotinate-nucleotide adenylyltransferase
MDSHNKIGIFGGTFNPIHYGHLRAAEEVREKLHFEKMLFIPSSNPPLKSGDLAPADERYEMTKLSLETNPFFDISDLECRKRGKSYTVETLTVLNKLYAEKTLYLVVGIDSFLEIPVWRQPEMLMELANFVVVSRPGFSFSGASSMIPEANVAILSEMDGGGRECYNTYLKNGREVLLLNVTPFPISSTAVRMLVRRGKSIKYLLPDKIESYIISHNLYRKGGEDP